MKITLARYTLQSRFRNLTLYMSSFLLLTATGNSFAYADSKLDVGCAVIDMAGDAMVQFSGVLQRDDIISAVASAIDGDNISSMTAKMMGIDGTLSVLVTIEGNSNSFNSHYPMNYKIVGNRIEPVLGQNLQKLGTYDDYRKSFGAFPNINCSASN